MSRRLGAAAKARTSFGGWAHDDGNVRVATDAGNPGVEPETVNDKRGRGQEPSNPTMRRRTQESWSERSMLEGASSRNRSTPRSLGQTCEGLSIPARDEL